MVGLVLPGKSGGKDAGRIVGIIPAGWVVRPCIVNSLRLSTEDDITIFEDKYCSTFNSRLVSPAMEVDRIEGSSVTEALDLQFLTTAMTTPLSGLLFT
jgi:hypothetical protein